MHLQLQRTLFGGLIIRTITAHEDPLPHYFLFFMQKTTDIPLTPIVTAPEVDSVLSDGTSASHMQQC